MPYAPEQYIAVLEKLSEQRDAALKMFDEKIDKVMSSMLTAPSNVDHETDQYLMIRDDFRAATNGYASKREAIFDDKLDILNGRLLKRLNDQGAKNMGAERAIVYKDTNYKPSCADWSITYKWIKETDNFEALEKRLTKKFMVDYLEEHKELPPGVSMTSEITVVVRRRTGKD